VGAQTISPANAGLETGATKPAGSPAELTGKERLGGKRKGEQRGENCNIPLDKRGTRPRPEIFAHVTIKRYSRRVSFERVGDVALAMGTSVCGTAFPMYSPQQPIF